MAYFIPTMYNITKPVGQGLPNVADDVRLVQVLLTEFARSDFGWAPPTPLPVDGMYSENLRQWILAYQKRVQRAGYNVVADGKVHPMPMKSKSDWSHEVGGYHSTMYSLNSGLLHWNREAHANVADRLRLPCCFEVL